MNESNASKPEVPVSSSAQVNPTDLTPAKDAKGGIGLLLPAVQKVRSPAGT